LYDLNDGALVEVNVIVVQSSLNRRVAFHDVTGRLPGSVSLLNTNVDIVRNDRAVDIRTIRLAGCAGSATVSQSFIYFFGLIIRIQAREAFTRIVETCAHVKIDVRFAIVLSMLRGINDYTRRCTSTVDRSGTRIFQYGCALDIVRV